MKLCMMSYTLARGDWGKNPDAKVLCDLAQELGLTGIDWVGTYGMCPAEVRKISDDYGMVTACYTFGAPLQSPDPAQRAEGLDTVKEGIETAKVLGADKIMVVISGLPDVPREEAREYALEGLAVAAPLGKQAGVTVTIEHFPGHTSPFTNSADMNYAISQVPDLRITFDNGNVLTGGEAPADGFRNSAEHVVFSHFKDYVVVDEGARKGLDGRFYEGALIGEGIVHPRPCLEAMHEFGYEGYINFEYEGSTYTPEEAMRKGVPPLQAMIEEVRAGGA